MMNETEQKKCERFKQIRTFLQMKQNDFSKEIKTTQGHVSDIENKRKPVSNRIIEIICLKYNINPKWFHTGDGEMFSISNEDERYAANVGKLQRTNDEAIIRWVNAIAETSPDTLKIIEDFMKKLLDIQD